MRSLLIISFHFPPDAAVGAVRPAEIVKHLPEYGWQPSVLTVKEGYYEHLDALRYDMKEVEVVRTKRIGTINSIVVGLKYFFSKNNETHGIMPKSKEWFTTKSVLREGVKSRLLRYYNSLLVYIPDKEIGWIFFGVIKGLRLMRKNKTSAIFTTSPPHSVHLIGLLLKLFTGKPWIVDFRDPWEVELKPRRSRSWLSELIEKKMEKAVITKGDWIISVTDQMTERLESLYPNHTKKLVTITNGYDSEALSKYRMIDTYDTYTITYVGSLYFGRDPFIFLKGVSELIDEGKIERQHLRIQFIGDCRVSDGKSVEDMVKKTCLEDIVTFVDQIPHQEALKEIAKSQALLLIAPCQPLQIPGKVFEYIGMRKTILSICENGATKSFLQDYPLAHVVSTNNLDEMKHVLHKLFAEGGEDMEKQLQDYPFGRYERKSIAKRISSLLDKSINVSRPNK